MSGKQRQGSDQGTTPPPGRRIVGRQVRRASILLPGLADARLRHYLTQAELAQKAGISRPTLANAEREKPIGVESAQKLATALGVSLDELQRTPDGA